MQCDKCSSSNDPDALFCTECGFRLGPEPASTGKVCRVYLHILFLIPVIALAAGIGYYKFILPAGIAAVVNGEEIKLAELDAEVIRTGGDNREPDNGLRYQVLNRLITERLALQEARKAGMVISQKEIRSAVSETRNRSGLNEAVFRSQIISWYGSMQKYEKALKRRLLINKFIAEKVVSPHADPQAAMRSWVQGLSSRAAVRVTLKEQLAAGGGGCACCNNKGSKSAGSGRQLTPGEELPSPGAELQEAGDAALRYWREKHGPESVTALPVDYGCHIQVDIVKDSQVVGSLRYQGGRISE